MSGENSPSRKIMDGLRAVYSLSHVQVLGEWVWDNVEEKWELHAKLRIESGRPDVVPNETNWYVVVEPNYPAGGIWFYPAVEQGISGTFRHQEYNGVIARNGLYRMGYLCLKTITQILGRHGCDIEPYGASDRLFWHFRRALEWLDNAARGTLIKSGEYFEVPQFQKSKVGTVVCWESAESFLLWKEFVGKSGVMQLKALPNVGNVWLSSEFKASHGEIVHRPEWGAYAEKSKGDVELGLWVLFPDVIALPPWEAPVKWGQLLSIGNDQGIDVRGLIACVSDKLRDGKRHFALFGYPIPARLGENVIQVKWQAALLPALTDKQTAVKGFRPGKGCKIGDRRLLSGGERVDWQDTENWHPQELLSRGRFNDQLTSSRVLGIGVGAIGSTMMEMLARGGVKDFIISDKGKLKAENLVRHTLGLQAMTQDKAEAVAERLEVAGPHVSTHVIAGPMENWDEEKLKLVERADIIIDCTGDDGVLHELQKMTWSAAKVICSVSISFGGKRVYIWIERSKAMSCEIFSEKLQPWLEKDWEQWKDVQLPRTGVGCWNPAFPARVDDIYMSACVALKYIERHVAIEEGDWRLGVVEQIEVDGRIDGIKVVEEVRSTE